MEKKVICQHCNKEFLMIEMELKFYTKMGYPEPEECPKCRHQKRQEFRGWRDFYKRECERCQKEVVTVYPPDSGFIIYCDRCFTEYYNRTDPLKENPSKSIDIKI